ncbi:MAG: (Fe-S)-binding protein [Bacteroidota bacterium]
MSKKQLNEQQKKSLSVLESRLDGRLLSYLNSCVHCGLCADSCHYYLSDPIAKYIPGRKAALISDIYRMYFTVSGKLIPGFFGAKKYDKGTIDELVDLAFGSCSMCGRCTVHCSIGLDIPLLVRTARSMLIEMDLVPKGLKSTVDAALNSGNNMNIPRDEFVDTLQWLEEDLQMEVNDKNASIPLDKIDTKILYTLNPREPKFFPLSISAIAKIFYAAKEDWTLSTHCYDVTNYSYFMGDDKGAGELTNRHKNEVKKIGAEILALAECGHGYRSYRWEGPRWTGEKYTFKAVSILEIIAEYIRDKKIKLDLSKITKIVTLHDPCNLVRNGGVIEEQRYILKNAVSNFVEMTPNRANNFCCGGGGGQLAMGEYAERRIKSGKIKAEQIRRTGAKVVATPCHNCIDQLMELNKEYDLKVEIKTISEIVANSLVL